MGEEYIIYINVYRAIAIVNLYCIALQTRY